MKKYFIVSLVKNGILGGGLVADDEAIAYHTGKVTVPAEYRRLVMKYEDIAGVAEGWLLILPTVTITMKDGAAHRFAVFFSRKRLVSTLREMGVRG